MLEERLTLFDKEVQTAENGEEMDQLREELTQQSICLELKLKNAQISVKRSCRGLWHAIADFIMRIHIEENCIMHVHIEENRINGQFSSI